MSLNACIYCGKEAARLCDFVLGFDAEYSDHTGRLVAVEHDTLIRCDAPLCLEHTSRQGIIHISSDDKDISGSDSIDWCCGHKYEEKLKPITIQEAIGIRNKHKCKSHGLHLI